LQACIDYPAMCHQAHVLQTIQRLHFASDHLAKCPRNTTITMKPAQSIKCLAGLLLILLPGISTAAEVDSFTHRHPLKDSAPFLDQVVNVWLEEAIIEANRPSLISGLLENGTQTCNEERLMEAL